MSAKKIISALNDALAGRVGRATVPKSQVEQNDDGTFTMPEWLAKDKGFI
jgi:hypothetical protein